MKRTLAVCVALLMVAVLLFAASPAHAHGTNRWDCLAHYESTHRWRYNGSSGYDGGLQFHPTTWRQYTGAAAPDYAYQASKSFQIKVAKRVVWYGFRKHDPQGPRAFGAWYHWRNGRCY